MNRIMVALWGHPFWYAAAAIGDSVLGGYAHGGERTFWFVLSILSWLAFYKKGHERWSR